MKLGTALLFAILGLALSSVFPVMGNGPVLAVKADRLLDVRNAEIVREGENLYGGTRTRFHAQVPVERMR